MTPSVTRCGSCRAPLADAARFCGRCGRPTEAHREELEARLRRRMGDHARAGASIAVVFVGVLLTLIAGDLLLDLEPPELNDILAQAAQLGVGILACLLLGRDARATVPLGSSPRFYAWATLGGLSTFGLAHVYVLSLQHILGDGERIGDAPGSPVLFLVSLLLLAPLIEEWLCRGVLWRAVERLAGARTALLLTAALFAMLHGLEAGVFSLPHRFALGLVAGWLRLRSGSLGPCIWAHLVHNVAAGAAEDWG